MFIHISLRPLDIHDGMTPFIFTLVYSILFPMVLDIVAKQAPARVVEGARDVAQALRFNGVISALWHSRMTQELRNPSHSKPTPQRARTRRAGPSTCIVVLAPQAVWFQ
jgi:hypothetical protein